MSRIRIKQIDSTELSSFVTSVWSGTIDQFQTDISRALTLASGNSGDIIILSGKINTLSGLHIDLQNNFTGLEFQFNLLSGQFSDLQADFSDITGDISTLETDIGSLSTQLITVSNTANEALSGVDELSFQVDIISGNLITLSGNVAAATGQITTDLDAAEASITGITANISDISGHIQDYMLGATQGALIYRGASDWTNLNPGTSGYHLKTNGASNDPSWENPYPAGTVVKKAVITSTSTFSTTNPIPNDNSIPQSGEGVEVISIAYTPLLTSSTIILKYSSYHDVTAAGGSLVTTAFFVDSDADAIGANAMTPNTTGYPHSVCVSAVYSNVDSSAKTFKVRVGATGANTAYINRYSVGSLYGGVSYIILEVEEIAV